MALVASDFILADRGLECPCGRAAVVIDTADEAYFCGWCAPRCGKPTWADGSHPCRLPVLHFGVCRFGVSGEQSDTPYTDDPRAEQDRIYREIVQ